jgi:hypothetical protein
MTITTPPFRWGLIFQKILFCRVVSTEEFPEGGDTYCLVAHHLTPRFT